MGIPIILVAVAAAIGVGLVVYGTVSSQRAAAPQQQVSASFRTLSDVRERLRRRFDTTGTPARLAAEPRISSAQRDLASVDVELSALESRTVRAATAVFVA